MQRLPLSASRLLRRNVPGLSRRATLGLGFGASVAVSGTLLGLHTLHNDAPPDALNDVLPPFLSHKFVSPRPDVDVEAWLRQNERSVIVGDPATGIARYDTVQLESNYPSEDDRAEKIVRSPQSGSFDSYRWSFFGVYDGHAGWETSQWLSKALIPAVVTALKTLYTSAPSQAAPSPEAIDKTITETFLALDDSIVNAPLKDVFASSSRTRAVHLLDKADAGSCAILAFYDSVSSALRIAITGDSRAVLGRPVALPDGSTTYEVHVLSADQNGLNPHEIERLAREHPGEENLTKGSRVMGWGLSRAFGDARMKWPLDVQNKLKEGYLGRSPRDNVKTPPYFTAEPVITTTRVQPGDFLILASDGLWESLTNEEAVGLIGAWVDRQANRGQALTGDNILPADLPVKPAEKDDTERYKQWRIPKRFANVDDNVATHIARNALGGADSDNIGALSKIKSPRARSFRDDLTVSVVFFSEPEAKRVSKL